MFHFKNNVEHITLLANGVYEIYDEKSIIFCTAPNILEEKSIRCSSCINFFYNKLEKVQENIKGFKLNSKRDACLLLVQQNSILSRNLLYFFNKYVDGFEYKEHKFFVNDELLSNDAYDDIEKVFLVATGILDINKKAEETKEEPEEELDPFEKRMRELEEKVKKTKEDVNKAEKQPVDMKDIIGLIVSELNVDTDKIMKYNGYSLKWFYSLAAKKVDEKYSLATMGTFKF